MKQGCVNSTLLPPFYRVLERLNGVSEYDVLVKGKVSGKANKKHIKKYFYLNG